MIKIFVHTTAVLCGTCSSNSFFFMEGQKHLLCPSNFNDDHFKKDQFKIQKPCIVIK